MLLKQHTTVTPLLVASGFWKGYKWTTLLLFGPSTSVPSQTSTWSYCCWLAGKQAPRREEAAYFRSVAVTQGSVLETEKSQANGRNLHFEHVCFCVVEPEIPYLLTKSLIFAGVGSSLLCFVGLGESRWTDVGSLLQEVL